MGDDGQMADSYSSDLAANPQDSCWACHKVNCTCDQDTMEAMDGEERDKELYENQER